MSDEISRRELLQVSAIAAVGAQALPAMAATSTTTVASFILNRLKQHGVTHLFGVPGATCDPLFAAAEASGLELVVTASDLEAGYAADGCARVRGLSAVAVTYGVGTMSLLSVIGGAYVERSPIVVINGGPSAEDLRLQRELGTSFSHSIGREKTDLTVFREVTERAERAETAAEVPTVVDAALRTALTRQRPVYLEIPKHLWEASCPAPGAPLDLTMPPSGQEQRLATELLASLRSAKRPAVLLGIELQRYGLQRQAIALLEKLGLPWATTLLAKAIIPEQTAGFVGVYAGERSVPSVKKIIESSDALLALGCVLGRQYRKLITQTPSPMLVVANDAVRVGRRPPVKAMLGPLLESLQRGDWERKPAEPEVRSGLSFAARRASVAAAKAPPLAEPGLAYDQVMGALSDAIDETFLTLTDTSLSMYPAAELNITGSGGFICNAVWQAIGFSVGAAVGVGLSQARRPLVICGDGGFQMTAQSLSTMAARKLRAIVVVLDNGHYGIEQFLLDPAYFSSATAKPRPYLGLNRWHYADFARSLGVTSVATVETEAQLGEAFTAAKAATGPALIAVRIRAHDLPGGLRA